jgi:thioredoxin-dependent peroxiredoxin
MPQERTGVVTRAGNPLTLIGPEIHVGDRASDFRCTDNDWKPVTLRDTAGRVRIFNVVWSLDTAVCDRQTRRFNEEAAKTAGLDVWTVSMDLPFAQKRWCGASGLSGVRTISDHHDASFGQNWGILAKERRLLARAIFVVDAGDTVRHVEVVKDITQEPAYDDALRAARALL